MKYKEYKGTVEGKLNLGHKHGQLPLGQSWLSFQEHDTKKDESDH